MQASSVVPNAAASACKKAEKFNCLQEDYDTTAPQPTTSEENVPKQAAILNSAMPLEIESSCSPNVISTTIESSSVPSSSNVSQQIDHSAASIGTTAGKYCKFCDKEFSKLEDFQSHMMLSGYICNNCLDFFSDMPWFTDAEAYFKYVKTVAVI